MTTLFPADNSVASECKSCGASITPTAKFCPECGALQSPQRDAPVSSDSSIPLAHPKGTEAEPDGGRLPLPADAKEDNRPIFASASSREPEDSEPKQSSGLLKLVMISGALVLAIVCVWGWHRQAGNHEEADAEKEANIHCEAGERLKSQGDLEGAKYEYEVSISKCPNCWEAKVAKEQLEWIVSAIAHRKLMQPQIDWVAKNLNGYVFGTHWLESPGTPSEETEMVSMKVNAQIVDMCTLNMTVNNDIKVNASNGYIAEVESTDTKMCSINLSNLAPKAFTIQQMKSLSTNEDTDSYLIVSDTDAVSCEDTNVGAEGDKNVFHTSHFSIIFRNREDAKAWLAGFKNMIHENCSPQNNPASVQGTQNVSRADGWAPFPGVAAALFMLEDVSVMSNLFGTAQ